MTDGTTLAYTYFTTLYPPELVAKVPPAYLSIVNQEPGVKSGAMPSKHMLVSDPSALAAEALRLSRDVGQNVWNSICAHGEDLGPWKRGKRSEVTLLPALWVDIDLAGPGHAAANLPGDVDDVVRGLLQPFALDPTLIVHSGGGLHVYWCLAELAQVNDANRAELQNLLKAWTARFQALAERHGWHVDNVSDLSRVLRPAGTLNRKPGRDDPPMVSILLAGGPRYTLEALQAHIGGTAPALDIGALIAGTKLVAATPAEPVATWSYEATLAEVRGKMARNTKPERKETLRLVIEGHPFAQPGDRDRALYQVCSWLAFYCPEGDPEAILEILTPSLEAMRLQAPDPDDYITLDDALIKISRCLDDARAKAGAIKATNERIAAALTRQSEPAALSRPKDSSRTASPTEGVVPQGLQSERSAEPVPLGGIAPPPSGAAGTYSAPVDTPATPVDPASLPGLGPEVLAILKASPTPMDLDSICGMLDRPVAKIRASLALLTLRGLLYLIHPKGGAKTWTATKPEEAPKAEQESEMLGDVSVFRTRWVNKDDLIAHGEEQLKLSGVPPHVADWEADRESFLAAMALNHTIITTPMGDKFLALPKPDKPGRAYGMYAKGELEESFWRDIKIVPEIWKRTYISAEGEMKEKPFRRVLSELSVPASKWLYDGLTEASYLDDNGVFHYKCWYLEPIEPEFNAECDAYLRTWGDDNYVRICDWFAHLRNLGQPATMLVLRGAPGDGKDLLVKAAACQFRKWGGAVSGAIAVDHFNADLNECPVIGCSEKLPSDWNGTPMEAAKLKDNITRQDHDFNDKNVKRVKLLGHLRWILSSNDSDFFPTKEALSQESQDAVLERLTVIESPREGESTAPKKYLAERGGFAFTGEWLSGAGTLVKHLRHIMMNHEIVYRHDRFGVQPFAGMYRLRLAVNTHISKLIVTGLVTYLVGEASKKSLSKSVKVGGGRVLVQIGELHRQWATLTALGEGAGGSNKIDAHKNAPDAQKFAEEVSERLASRDDVTIDGKLYKSIRTELLLDHAKAIGREGEIKEALAMTEEAFLARQAATKTPGLFGGK